MGTLKIDVCHMYHLQVEMSCWTCIRVGSSIWAVNHIFAKRHILTYCIRCSRPSVRVNDFRACACTSRMISALLSTLESEIGGAKGNPQYVNSGCLVGLLVLPILLFSMRLNSGE